MAVAGVAFGIRARARSRPGTPERRSAARGLALNALVPVLVVAPNVAFALSSGG